MQGDGRRRTEVVSNGGQVATAQDGGGDQLAAVTGRAAGHGDRVPRVPVPAQRVGQVWPIADSGVADCAHLGSADRHHAVQFYVAGARCGCVLPGVPIPAQHERPGWRRPPRPDGYRSRRRRQDPAGSQRWGWVPRSRSGRANARSRNVSHRWWVSRPRPRPRRRWARRLRSAACLVMDSISSALRTSGTSRALSLLCGRARSVCGI